MNISDIEALVQETLHFNSQNIISEEERESLFFGREDETQNLIPSAPGIIFHLEKKSSTFVIRVTPSENIQDSYRNIVSSPENFPSLRLNFDEIIEDQLSYYECESLEVAYIIQQNFANKRFPLYEENVFNISDPSDHWWLERSDRRVKLHFNLANTTNTKELIKLGPLNGTGFLTNARALYGYFKLIFNISEYSASPEHLVIEPVDASHPLFRMFLGLLQGNTVDEHFWDHLKHLEKISQEKTYFNDLLVANTMLRNLSSVRRFWTLIEQKL